MRHTCEATSCDRATHDVICRNCRNELLAALCELVFVVSDAGNRGPGLLDALEQASVRRTKLDAGQSVTSRSAQGPTTPYDPRASREANQAANTITTWARSLQDAFSSLQPAYSTLEGACAWMASLPTELQTYVEAGRLHHELTRLVKAIERVVDRRDELRYAGMCSTITDAGTECVQDLFGRPDRAHVTCPACGATHDVAKRREQLYRAMEDQLATAVDCSRVVPNLIGRELSASTIRNWAREGRLQQKPPHPYDERHAPRYRIGDVATVARQAQTRRRRAKDPARRKIA